MNTLLIRPATAQDIPRMLQLVAQAQAYFCAAGIDQWQDGYPNAAVLQADIAKGASYIIEENGCILATFMAGCEEDPNYAHIDGAWRTHTMPYAVLHRIAVEENAKGKGVAAQAVAFACRLAQAQQVGSVRVDTHAQNASMRRMLEKNGFVLCGHITLQSGAPRVAYERLLP